MSVTSASLEDWAVLELAQLRAEPWQVRLLKANGGYTSWGPHEGDLARKGDWWNARVSFPAWADFVDAGLSAPDDLNEVVNFYFEIDRASARCAVCSGEGQIGFGLATGGVPTHSKCAPCDGHGDIYTASVAHVSLVLWYLVPRKSCSRAVTVERLEEGEVEHVLLFLERAAQRANDRFGGARRLLRAMTQKKQRGANRSRKDSSR